MSLVAAYIVPHPPLAVPEVGRGEEKKIEDTLEGYREVARRIASIEPDTIMIISPHTAYYADWIFIAGGNGSRGDLARFGAPDVQIDITYDVAMRNELERLAQSEGIPAGVVRGSIQNLDHGMLVPLYFVDKEYPSDRYKAISIGGSALPRNTLKEFGRCIARVAESSGKKCVLLVSGDLSHKLKPEGPYGFDPAGPLFDEEFVRIVEAGDPSEFALLDTAMCEDAAECGLSGFIMMSGAIEEASEDGGNFSSELISHEGPFGVGYGVAAYEKETSSADNDPLVALARTTIDQYVCMGSAPTPIDLPSDSPERAGCFVSIHTASTGELRGCIGTIEPVQETLAEEIIANAISASMRDPRFPAITAAELDDLDINVDVLFPPEASSLDQMDPKRYGIIVTQGFKRGLLLPDLEGIDSVEDQFRIACMKAGIDPFSDPHSIGIERFEVVRHK